MTRSLVDLLRTRAESHADRGFKFLVGDEVAETLSYAELDRDARRIAAGLSARGTAPGTPVLLAFPPGLAFVSAFWGCLYAGAIAVPVPAPGGQLARTLPRLHAIAANAGASIALSTVQLGALPALDPCTLDGETWCEPSRDPDAVALLQYTSGSTREPRGVMVTHANLLHNLSMLRSFHEDQEHMVMVHWLPLYHDMGLIRGMLSPVEMGGDCVMMSPLAFVEQPRRWLAALTRHRATTTGAPNFGFELAVRKIDDVSAFDLSALRIAFCSAEPIRHATLERFAAKLAPCGFHPAALRPSYGLAEATVVVAGELERVRTLHVDADALRDGRVVPAEHGHALVSCGRPLGGQTVTILDEHDTPAPPDRIGEVCITGPSVARGYWPDEPFGPVLHTGDLGWLSPDGDLYITGRKKDLIIVRGQNYYPQDIEAAAEEAAPIRPGCSAAFAIDGDAGETVVLVCEHEPAGDWPALVAAIRGAAGEALGLSIGAIAFVARGQVPKTASGKVQRSLARERYLSKDFDIHHHWQLPGQSR